MKKRFKLLTIILALCISVGLIVFYAWWWIHQPEDGQTATEISDRSREFITDNAQNASVRVAAAALNNTDNNTFETATTPCFSFTFPFEVKYLRTESSDSAGQADCRIKALMTKPRAQLSLHQVELPSLNSLSEHTGVTLRRQQSDQYSSVTLNALSTKNYVAFESQTELIIFIWQKPYLTTLALYDAAAITDQLKSNATQLLDKIPTTPTPPTP